MNSILLFLYLYPNPLLGATLMTGWWRDSFRISWINSLFLYLSVIFKDKIDISHIWQKIKLKKHIFKLGCVRTWASQVMLVVKNVLVSAGDIREMGLIPGLRRSPGGGHDNPLQYSFLENPMDKESWQATVHRVTKNWTWLKWSNMHACVRT